MTRRRWIRWYSELSAEDVPLVGGKNASLGEMIRELSPLGVRVPDGFAITAEAYRYFLEENGLAAPLRDEISTLERGGTERLVPVSHRVRDMILGGDLPPDLAREITDSYRELSVRYGQPDTDVAVRSSATAEDLPAASFAGQQESFLNVHGEAQLLESVRKCFASLFTPRAISYREDLGFDHFEVALSVGVQKMVRADLASSGVIFTLDPDSGFEDVILVTSSWGLGESIVQGRVVPDQFYVHKPTLKQGYAPLIRRQVGSKETKLVYDETGHRSVKTVPVAPEDRRSLSVSDKDVLTLARWALLIEEHYSGRRGRPTPMDIEWARDGTSGELFIVQARPETVHSRRESPALRLYELKERGPVLAEGLAIGSAISAGRARLLRNPAAIERFRPKEVLVTEITDPDWEPIMKSASAIVTERGGRTSHAAIVARELGIPAVVGAAGATGKIEDGQSVTVCCAEGEAGRVYAGILPYETKRLDPAELPRPRTRIMMNVGDPERAFELARIPNDGVGLARMEFIFAGWVGIHPLALTRYESLPPKIRAEVARRTAGYEDRTRFFVDRLAQGIGTLAAAFWPREVILRFSDFKTNEYARLLGGELFEPGEENPMLGWRGASRYYHPDYREGFLLEVEAVRRVRKTFGLKNLKVMVPFCRTPEEGRRVLAAMEEGGLIRGEDGLEVYVMAEIPSNIILAREFAQIFDGFSIGSNDLTQLVLGVDRDSERVANLFDENNEAVRWACAQLIEQAHAAGKKVGICGQAPSDYPEFAAFLAGRGIDSISLSPDAVMTTALRVLEAEGERTPAA
ncbi:phosphoenolpyruvate synthase [Rubrobacter taiwanensis]|jgi:pyruvate,water dikinase|uniref:Phosphoenolpyruvate synthase n=1 Tax=Rubrobacter taiwanensis TaxID=185139 RepID=A0A4R1BH02_9ACTN|nr:phosphoenolpyruvate synthase [Rubrobacter taiwanensis]TCJ16489.1 phosphoenolpyruvate synthase [Rubrobacter taiwanensis]